MGKLPLEGIKVVGLTWAVAGPLVTKYLADYGATVIQVETNKRADLTRGGAFLKRGTIYHLINANKYNIGLNLNSPQGIDVAKRLMSWSDIVVENFSAGTLERWGLGYDDLKKLKPDIIMLRSSNQGQTGPNARFAAFGIPLNGLVGFAHFTGWPDREPMPMQVAYTDVVSPRFAVSAIMAALIHRHNTGMGQCLDLSQLESGVQFLAQAILEFTANGRMSTRAGNSDHAVAPHGAYQCKGDDRWCVISVNTAEQWEAFCRALDNPPWTIQPEFVTLTGRKENEEKLNRLVQEWTMKHSAEEIMNLMQKAGVPAAVVENAEDIFKNHQLKHRGGFWMIDNPEIGEFPHLGQSSILSKTPAGPRFPAPAIGEHTAYICTQLLGMTDAEFTELFQAGVLE